MSVTPDLFLVGRCLFYWQNPSLSAPFQHQPPAPPLFDPRTFWPNPLPPMALPKVPLPNPPADPSLDPELFWLLPPLALRYCDPAPLTEILPIINPTRSLNLMIAPELASRSGAQLAACTTKSTAPLSMVVFIFSHPSLEISAVTFFM